MAGIIDSTNYFTCNEKVIIIGLNSLDYTLAYFLKKNIGFGKVKKMNQNNETFLALIIQHEQGILKFIELINEKLRTTTRYNLIINNILKQESFKNFDKEFTMLPKHLTCFFENH